MKQFEGLIDHSKSLLRTLSRYRYPLIGTLIVGLFAFTVWRIDYHSAAERDNEAYEEQLSTVERVNFDEDAVEKILQLRDTGIDIEPNFPRGRTNPF